MTAIIEMLQTHLMIHLFKFICFCFFGLGSNLIFAQTDFSSTSLTDQRFPVFRNCVADMNGDQLDDIVAIDESSLVIAYQKAEGGFDLRNLYYDFDNVPLWSITAGDIDANGYNDLCIGGGAVSFMMANSNGSGYTEVSKAADIFPQRSNLVDIDNDGHLDAFVCNDVNINHPYRNDGTGQLTLDYNLIQTPLDIPGNYSSVWTDYDNDGDLDMHMAKCVLNSMSGDPARTNLLYNNDGNGNFVEVAVDAGLADNDQSWISAIEDFDNDGDFDLLTMNHEFSNAVMRNNGDGTFTNVTEDAGLLDSFLGAYEGFAADFDNDGDVDFLRDMPNTFYYNNGDMTFTRVTANFQNELGAIGDLNNDGFIDVVSKTTLILNRANANHWFKLNTIGAVSNRNGIGARVELYGQWGKMIREVRATQSWSGMSSLATHFGLGQHTAIDSLVVKWPSGLISKVVQPAIDQSLTIHETDCPTAMIPLTVSGPLELCPGEAVTLAAPVGGSYLWSNGETGETITTAETGGYNVTTTLPNGCTQTSRVIYVKNQTDPVNIIAPDGTDFCGNPFRLEADTNLPVIWSTGETTRTIWATEAGEYSVTLEACPGVTSTGTIEIIRYEFEQPEPLEIEVIPGQSLAVDLPYGDDVIWWDAAQAGNVIFIGASIFLTDVVETDTFWVQTFASLGVGQDCYSERVPIIVFVEPNSTQTIPDLYGLEIFPNPVTDQIHIKMDKPQLLTQARLRNINGQAVSLLADKQENSYRLPNVNAGIYWLELMIDQQVYTHKIVVID